MLKRMGIRKIMVTTTAIFLIGILYLFPVKTPKVEKNITYIDESKFSDVFLLDKNNYLSEVSVVTEGDSLESKLKSKIDSITKKNVSKSNFKPIIPVNTKVISLNVKDNLCTIDFSKEFLSISASLEEKLIEAVVYTLTSESEITEVIIKVEGSILERLPNSNKLLPNKFDRSYGINKEYDINSLYDLTKTTIYYVGEDEGDTYYVPV